MFVAPSLLMILGCSSWLGPSSLPEDVSLPVPEELYSKILFQSRKVKSLKGSAKIRIQSEDRRNRLEAVIACDRKERLRFEALDFLGHVVFLALIREDGFFAYSVSENRYLAEPVEGAALREILGVSLKASELIAMILGSPFFVPLESPELSVEKDRTAILLNAAQEDGGLHYRIRVDRQGRPVQSVLFRKPGKGVNPRGLQVEFGRYRRVGNHDFPFRIRAAEIPGKESFEIAFQEIVLNEDLQADLFRFVPPEDAEEMIW